MALPAAGVTYGAVLLACCVNLLSAPDIDGTGPGLDHRPKWRQGDMQAVSGTGCYLIMAFTADALCITVCGVFYKTGVGRLPVWICSIAAVTAYAGNGAMIGFQKRRVHIDLLVKLQRSQRPASPFTGGFGRHFRFRLDLFNFPAKSYQFLQIDMALHALAACLICLDLKAPREDKKNE